METNKFIELTGERCGTTDLAAKIACDFFNTDGMSKMRRNRFNAEMMASSLARRIDNGIRKVVDGIYATISDKRD